MVRVKICGITRLQDAEAAVSLGADALGFVFAESPRKISVEKARSIIRAVGPWTAAVGVFVNEKPEVISRIAGECKLSAIQLHGDEDAETVSRLAEHKVIKAFRVGDGFKANQLKKYDADAFLFDTKAEKIYGGTGKTFDWNLLGSMKLKKPVIISGGLQPLNVKRAVRFFSPYGVDVSGGVEIFPGKKDHKKMKEFIHNAKTA